MTDKGALVTTLPLRWRSPSRFSGKALADILGELVAGVYDEDTWDLAGHRDMASGSKRRLYFSAFPRHLRDALKELLILSTRPFLHTDVTAELTGRKPKDLKTVVRWLGHLAIDLSWLHARAGSLATVAQADYDAWKDESGLKIDYRRINALKSFALYARAMSSEVDRLIEEPWPGQSALAVGGGPKVLQRVNSTAPLSVSDVLGPWLTLGMFLVQHGDTILDAYVRTTQGATGRPVLVNDLQGRQVRWLGAQVDETHITNLVSQLAGACLFVTAAFTGMRASELDAVPRKRPLEPIEVAGATRWLLRSYLVKGMAQPREEKWLVPPVVADAIRVIGRLLDVLDIPWDVKFGPTGKVPLFDRRALSNVRRSTHATMRMDRAIDRVAAAGWELVQCELVAALPTKADHKTSGVSNSDLKEWVATLVKPDGRELRRTFARIVAARPHGPQAAMEQFKWQHPETAAGYFRVAPDAVALGQRELYEEVTDLYEEIVVDAVVTEFHVWEQAVERGEEPLLPTGPDGRRKRDIFKAVADALGREPRVEEDGRRLRLLLRRHTRGIRLTEFGWCDWDEDFALCDGEGGPFEARCQPNRCLNHSTTSTSLAAHQVKHDRLIALSRDRGMPQLARDQARENADVIERDLGDLISQGGM